MHNLLVRDALDALWCVPDPFNHVILAPARITAINGRIKNMNYAWGTLALPNSTSVFHVYQIGQISPVLVDLFEATSSWKTVASACNATKVMCDLYTKTGLQLPKTRSWYIQTKDKNLLVAVEINGTLECDLNTDQLYMRIYKNSYYELQGLTSKDYVDVQGGVMTSKADIIALRTKINQILALPGYAGGLLQFINGYRQETINVATVSIGDVAEFVYDGSIYSIEDFRINECPTFVSERDSKTKQLLHRISLGDGDIDYVDEVDVYMFDSRTMKSVYVHKNAADTLRMVTYKDYSVVAAYLPEYFERFADELGVVAYEDLHLRLYVRHSGHENPLIVESHLTKYLNELGDVGMQKALIGTNSALPHWRAPALENSPYVRLMGATYEQITPSAVEDAYGYSRCNYVLAPTHHSLIVGGVQASIAIPAAFQKSCTAFEYDANGYLLGFYVVAPLSLLYTATQASATSVEFVEGIGSTVLDETYDFVATTIDPSLTYRYYMDVVRAEVSKWQDATNTNYYSVANGVAIWNPENILSVVRRVVRSNKNFLLYKVNLSTTEGLLVHSLRYTANRPSGQITTSLTIPLGELDLWLNNKALIQGVDYIYNFPTITIISKEHLVDLDQPQVLTVRYTGFCGKDFKPMAKSEVGFVYTGLMSVNGRYDLHQEKVMKYVSAGATLLPSDVTFVETAASATGLTDGKPYMVRDVVNPLRGMLSKDPYDFYQSGLVIEGEISDYMSLEKPQQVASEINPILNKYELYSPFLCKILHDLVNGYLVDDALASPYSDSLVRELCKPYEYLLNADPILNVNTPDLRYCVIHPHWAPYTVSVNVMNYTFLENVARVYSLGKVNLSPLVSVDAGAGSDPLPA